AGDLGRGAGGAVGGGDAAGDLLGRGPPVDREGVPAQQRQLGGAGDLAGGLGGGDGPFAGGDLADGLGDAFHGRVGDAAVVEGALGDRRRQIEPGGGPDGPGVHLLDGGERGHAPAGSPLEYGVVQRGGTAVADRPGVDDDGGPPPPHLLGDPVLQEGAQDQVGVDPFDLAGQRFGRRERGGEFDTDIVPLFTQGTPNTLGQSVEG